METNNNIKLIEILKTIEIQHLTFQQSTQFLNATYFRNRLSFEINNNSIPVNFEHYNVIQQYLAMINTSTAMIHIYSRTNAYKILSTVNNKTFQNYMNEIISEKAKIIVTFN